MIVDHRWFAARVWCNPFPLIEVRAVLWRRNALCGPAEGPPLPIVLLVGRSIRMHIDLLVQVGVQVRDERALLLPIELLLTISYIIAEQGAHRGWHLAVHRHWREDLLLVPLVNRRGRRPVMRSVSVMTQVILVMWRSICLHHHLILLASLCNIHVLAIPVNWRL